MPDAAQPRLSAREIYEQVIEEAIDELERPAQSLAYSALFAGFTIGSSALVVALVMASIGGSEGAALIAAFAYPIGYLAVILGRAQFFTENTLYPVLASFRDSSRLPGTARLWLIVFTGNLIGVMAFALLVTETNILSPAADEALVSNGVKDAGGGFSFNFWSAVVTGWLIAQIAWLVEAADATIARIAVIWGLAFVVALGGFDHCIASTPNVLSALLDGEIGIGRFAGWLGTATLGNIAGGVLIVSLVNYGQARRR